MTTTIRAALAALSLVALALPADPAGAGDGARPLAVSCTTTFQLTGLTSARLQGTCRDPQLGDTSAEATQSLGWASGAFTISTSAVYTAADGDRLYGRFVGTGTQTPDGAIAFSGTETYERGTGRFAGASGRVAVTGTARFTSPASGVSQYVGVGTIAY